MPPWKESDGCVIGFLSLVQVGQIVQLNQGIEFLIPAKIFVMLEQVSERWSKGCRARAGAARN